MYLSLFDIGGFINWVWVGKVVDGHYTFGHVFQAGVQNIKQCDCWTRFRRWFYRKKAMKKLNAVFFFIKKDKGKSDKLIDDNKWIWLTYLYLGVILNGCLSHWPFLWRETSWLGRKLAETPWWGTWLRGKGEGKRCALLAVEKKRFKEFIILQIANKL